MPVLGYGLRCSDRYPNKGSPGGLGGRTGVECGGQLSTGSRVDGMNYPISVIDGPLDRVMFSDYAGPENGELVILFEGIHQLKHALGIGDDGTRDKLFDRICSVTVGVEQGIPRVIGVQPLRLLKVVG